MSRHVMVCDENEERRNELSGILEKLKFRVMPCFNQNEGVLALGTDPAIAFIHLNTGMTLEAADLAALQWANAQNDTLFFLMGAADDAPEKAASLGLRFDGFLPDNLSLKTVRRLLKESRAL